MENYSFLDPQVLETLIRAQKRGMEFVGSATSDFQSHPYLSIDKKESSPRSDWELQVHHLLRNKPSKIVGEQDISQFPEFFKKRNLYIQRSAELGENMFRISFDFGRLCAKPGEFDMDLMSEYIITLASIRDKGLEPMLTLYHWPSPLHLLKLDKSDNIIAGAWENPEILHHFRFYLKNALRSLADKDFIRKSLRASGFSEEKVDKLIHEGLVRYFISVNEPFSLLAPTYIFGVFPPYKKFRFDMVGRITTKLVEAHDIVLTEVRNSSLPTTRGPLQIGAAHTWTFYDGWLGKITHHIANSNLTRKFEEGRKETDFVGLHYYFRWKFSPFGKGERVYGDHPHFGDVHPQGIFKVLKEMNADYPGKNIMITEFGFSDYNGLRRPYWILETVRYVIQAMEQGIPVKGMLLWTLVNNFEWDLGTHQKFGLFDEGDLDKSLTPSSGENIKSWEAWKAATAAILHPNRENLLELQRAYDRARHQFRAAAKK